MHILQTCRQTYNEAYILPFKYTTIAFTHPLFLEKWLAAIKPARRNAIVALKSDHQIIYEIGPYYNATDNRLEITDFPIEWRFADITTLSKQLPALRTFHVVVRPQILINNNASREHKFVETGRALRDLKDLVESVLPDVEVITELRPNEERSPSYRSRPGLDNPAQIGGKKA